MENTISKNKKEYGMTSPLTKVAYYFSESNAKKVKELMNDAEILTEGEFYKFVDLIFKIYGSC